MLPLVMKSTSISARIFFAYRGRPIVERYPRGAAYGGIPWRGVISPFGSEGELSAYRRFGGETELSVASRNYVLPNGVDHDE